MDCTIGLMRLDASIKPVDIDQSENDSEHHDFEVLDGLRLSEPDVAFKEVKIMKKFNVLINDLNIDSEFSKLLLTKYYDLFCSKNHSIVNFFSRIINIADAMKSCSVTTLEGNFYTWDKTLRAFEGLGMNIFLGARLDQFVSLAS
ncbi:unnamed protein product [Malus baccata var. baccata]